MPQIFHPSTNTISKFSIFGAVFIIAALAWVYSVVIRSSYVLQTNVAREQPVPFSHRHHVGGLGIDCRYCHTSVEVSPFAGIPPTKTCMNCHSQIWTNSQMLEPVRASFRSGKPLQWNRVHHLAGFVYFNHSIHIDKGIGCVTCHGRIDTMPLTAQENTLQMEWCLQCHRNPERYVRPREYIFSMDWDWQPPKSQLTEGPNLVQQYKIAKPELLTSCSVCHR